MKTFRRIIAASALMLAFIITAKAQAPKMPKDETTKLVTYTEVVNSQGSKDSLFLRCVGWISKNYKSAATATEKSDKVNGEIVIKHQFEVFNYDKNGNKIAPASAMIKYTLTIIFKDGRYKYTLTRLNIKGASYTPLEKWFDESPIHDEHLKQVDNYVKELIKSLKKEMEYKAPVKKEEW